MALPFAVVEDKAREIGGGFDALGIALPAVSAVSAHQQRAVAAGCPDRPVI